MAIKAIRLAAMLATSLMDAEAPAAAASKIFLSFLKNQKKIISIEIRIIMFYIKILKTFYDNITTNCQKNKNVLARTRKPKDEALLLNHNVLLN